MKNIIRFVATLLVTVSLAYAALWMTWQFAILINTVTAQVWK